MGGVGGKGERTRNKELAGMFGLVAGFVTDSYIQSWTFYHNRWAQQ